MNNTKTRGWFDTPRVRCVVCHKSFNEEELDENDMCNDCREEAEDRATLEVEGFLHDTISEEQFMMEMKGGIEYD